MTNITAGTEPTFFVSQRSVHDRRCPSEQFEVRYGCKSLISSRSTLKSYRTFHRVTYLMTLGFSHCGNVTALAGESDWHDGPFNNCEPPRVYHFWLEQRYRGSDTDSCPSKCDNEL